MSEENQKKLYLHYLSSEQKERAAEILKSFPHFEVKEKVEKPKKENKSKGKK